jgi:hypothetical protein
MLVINISRPRGYYAGLPDWLNEHVGEEGTDYSLVTVPIGYGMDTHKVAAVEFTDARKETIARLVWG